MTQSVLQKIQRLDARTDHQEIIRLTTAYEYPFLMQKALEFALFRTYAVPSIGKLLDHTNHFHKEGQKRYDDTALLIAEWVENGYDSHQGRAAIKRMNQLHHHWPISNDDYLYVLSCFIYVPRQWYTMYGTRNLTEKECLAMYYFWVEVGKLMGMKNIPESDAAFEQFFQDYERQHFAYSDEGRRVADATINVFLSWYPALMRPLVLRGIYALMDDPLREAFRYPAPSPAFKSFLNGTLRLVANVIRLFPPRRKPYQRTKEPNRTYPHGYQIEKIGATDLIAK